MAEYESQETDEHFFSYVIASSIAISSIPRFGIWDYPIHPKGSIFGATLFITGMIIAPIAGYLREMGQKEEYRKSDSKSVQC
jgi:hypothetical protein